jgi:ubiquinone/menaquinone biosynthesis C-methylase UbiE
MVNFDRVAGIYDATRGLPEDVSDRVADTIVAATNATPNTQFLELGVGTGRIARPLIERGYPYIGVDISSQMIEHLREKVGDPPNLTLIQGDITHLPLGDASQDVVLSIHVFHLVDRWREALEEARRVLRPGGYFVYGGNHAVEPHPGRDVRREWVRLVGEAGGRLRERYAEWQDIHRAVTEMGARTATYQAAQWEDTFRPIDLMEALRQRTYSASWTVDDAVLEAVHPRLVAWGEQQYGDLTQSVGGTDEVLIFAARFPDG